MVHKEPLFHFVNAGVDFGALQYRIILSEYLSQLGGYFWAVRLRLNEWLAGALLMLEEGCTAAYGRVETSWRRDPSALLVKGKWGEQALWEIELRLESIKVENWVGCVMHILRCGIFDLAFKYFTSCHHNSWGDLRHSARWLEVSSCKVIMRWSWGCRQAS